MDKNSWILVTGGAGLIGSAIVYERGARSPRLRRYWSKICFE